MPQILGAVAGAGLGLVGAGVEANAARQAAGYQTGAADQANNMLTQQYDQARSDQQPWYDAGKTALGQMQDPYFQKSFTMNDFQTDPGYQFRMDEGQKAIERSAAAKGGLQTGGTMKAIADYGQNFASNEYQNAYNRFNNDQSTRYGRLGTLAGMGQNSAQYMGSLGMNYANAYGNNVIGAGNAQAGSRLAQGQIWGGALNQMGGQLMQAGMMGGSKNPGEGTPPGGAGAPAGSTGGYSLGAYNPSSFYAGPPPRF